MTEAKHTPGKSQTGWPEVGGYIKEIITSHDHVNDDPYKTLSDINDILDKAFGYMPSAIDEIKAKGEA